MLHASSIVNNVANLHMFQIHSFSPRPRNTLSGTLTFTHIFWLHCLLQLCHNLPLPHLVLASVQTLKLVLCKWCCQVWLPAHDGGCPRGPHLGQCLCAVIRWPLETLCRACFQSRNPLVTWSVRLFPFKWIWIFLHNEFSNGWDIALFTPLLET